jgi:hypothetical protein
MKKNIPKFVNPRYYNWITKTLIVAGIALISKPLWREILNELLNKIGLKISNEYDPILGLIIIILALAYNLISQYITTKEISQRDTIPQKEISKCKTFGSFYELCQSLIPLMDDNKYIFKTFGPNSSASEIEPLRSDLTLWNQSRIEYIIPNNEIISCIIIKNKSLIPVLYIELFERLKAHLYSFKKHVENPNFDYTSYQFPSEIEFVIKNNCYNMTTNSEKFKRVSNWLNNKLLYNEIHEKIIIGSFLFSTESSNDLDILIHLNTSNKEALSQLHNKLKDVEYSFKLKFKKNLHLTIFTSHEASAYNEFLNRNNYNYLLNGKRFTLFNSSFYKECFK